MRQSPDASPPELLPLPSDPLSPPPELLPELLPLPEPLSAPPELLPLLEPLLDPLLDPVSSPLSAPPELLPELLLLLPPPDDEELHPPTTPAAPSASETRPIPMKRYFMTGSFSFVPRPSPCLPKKTRSRLTPMSHDTDAMDRPADMEPARSSNARPLTAFTITDILLAR